MPAPRLALTILAVPDLRLAVRFYQDAFGWEQLVAAPSYAEFVQPNGQRFGLYERGGFAKNVGGLTALTPPGALAPVEFYFEVDDFDAALGRLEGAGARCLSPRAPRDWGDDCAYFSDPNGVVLVVAQRSAGT